MTMASNPPIVKSPNTCWRYAQGAYCPEELCHYQHGPPLSTSRLPRRSANSYGRTACLFFAKGHCKYGESCSFAHIPLSGGKDPSPNEAPSSSRSDQSQSSAEIITKSTQVPSPKRKTGGVSTTNSSTDSSRISDQPSPSSGHGDFESGGGAAELDRPHGDRSRLQVYDDRKVLVLSGGVMLGTGSQGTTPSQKSPKDLRRARSTQLSTSPSPSSLYSSEYLATPVDWSVGVSPTSTSPQSWGDDQGSSVPISPSSFAPGPSPFTRNTFRYPPQTTTITITHPPNPPPSTSQNKKNRTHRGGQRVEPPPITMEQLSTSTSHLSLTPHTPKPAVQRQQAPETPELPQKRPEIVDDDQGGEDWDEMPVSIFPPTAGLVHSLTRANTPLPPPSHEDHDRRRSSIGVLAEQQEYTRERERLRGYSKLRRGDSGDEVESEVSSSRRGSTSTHRRVPSA